jgi:hypothetical protein
MLTRRSLFLVGFGSLVLAWLGLVLGCGREAKPEDHADPSPPVAKGEWFEDVTARSGIDFVYRNGEEANHYAILESLGGGVALIDYDGDGLLDIFLTGGGKFEGPEGKQIAGQPCRLYRNLGGYRFQDVTAAVGLDTVGNEPWFYTHGCAVVDYDNDGWPDLLVTGYGRLALFHNVPDERTGGRRFQEVTRQAGLRGEHIWGTSAAFADFDGDGYADLYVCQYVDWSFANHPRCPGYSEDVPFDICSPTQFEARPHALYHNNGNGTFTLVGKDAGLHIPRKESDYEQLEFLSPKSRDRLRQTDLDRDFGKGLGVLVIDVDGDGHPDIYVANDTTDKFLYLNRSKRGEIRFDDVAVFAGAARDERGSPNGSMGVDAADCYGNGLPSLLVTNYQNELPALYRNKSTPGSPAFLYSTTGAGLSSMGREFVGFGTAFLDVNNDGWEDIVIVNGHVVRHPKASSVPQKPMLFRSRGKPGGIVDARFIDASMLGGSYFLNTHRSRGLAVGDLSNSGRPDLVISHINEPVTVLRNSKSHDNHWIGVRLMSDDHRDLVGTKLTLVVGDQTLTRFAKSGGSYLSSSDQRILFGLGTVGVVGHLIVTWPWGQEDHWEGLAIDRYWTLTVGGKASEFTTVPGK